MKAKGRPRTRQGGGQGPDSGLIWPARDQKDANRPSGLFLIRLAAGLMARFAAEMGNIDGRHRIVGPDGQALARRHFPKRGLHADHRQGASIAGNVKTHPVAQSGNS